MANFMIYVGLTNPDEIFSPLFYFFNFQALPNLTPRKFASKVIEFE